MNTGKYFIVTFSVLVLASCSLFSKNSAVVYYVPFSVMTYFPITENDIVCDFETKYITEENSKVSNIKYHIYKGKVSNKKYDNLQIRAKVIINNEVYYVDKNGVALVNEEYIEINVPEFEKFIHKNVLYEHRNRYNNDGCKYHE